MVNDGATHDTMNRPFGAAASGLAGMAAVGFAVAGRAFAKEAGPPPKPENVISPDVALERLLAGNQRYIEGVARRHDFKAEREALSMGQNPFAAS